MPGLLGTLSAKTFIKHEKFDEINSEFEIKLTSFWPEKHLDENASEASHFFLMHPFPDVYQAFGTTNSHQKPIYVSPDGRK